MRSRVDLALIGLLLLFSGIVVVSLTYFSILALTMELPSAQTSNSAVDVRREYSSHQRSTTPAYRRGVQSEGFSLSLPSPEGDAQ